MSEVGFVANHLTPESSLHQLAFTYLKVHLVQAVRFVGGGDVTGRRMSLNPDPVIDVSHDSVACFIDRARAKMNGRTHV